MLIYEKNGKVINYQVITKQIKNSYFRPKNGYLLVTTNKHTKEAIILSMIEDNFDKFYMEIQNLSSKHGFSLWGRELDVILNKKGSFSYEVNDESIIINSMQDYDRSIIRVLYEELKKEYSDYILNIYPLLKQLELAPVKIVYRYLKTKYGSCNIRKKEITINIFLGRIDKKFFRYVVCHEYAHLVVPNHQKAFYDVLNLFMINHKEIQKQLKKIAIYQ